MERKQLEREETVESLHLPDEAMNRAAAIVVKSENKKDPSSSVFDDQRSSSSVFDDQRYDEDDNFVDA